VATQPGHLHGLLTLLDPLLGGPSLVVEPHNCASRHSQIDYNESHAWKQLPGMMLHLRHSPLFVSLRDISRLQGMCGVCEFRNVCGGSRARPFARTGDPFAEEPCCVDEPKAAAMRSHLAVQLSSNDPPLKRLLRSTPRLLEIVVAGMFGEWMADRRLPHRETQGVENESVAHIPSLRMEGAGGAEPPSEV
jgi:hypothetical protein